MATPGDVQVAWIFHQKNTIFFVEKTNGTEKSRGFRKPPNPPTVQELGVYFYSPILFNFVSGNGFEASTFEESEFGTPDRYPTRGTEN